MISNRLEERHWLHVAIRYATDFFLFFTAFLTALRIRFPEEWAAKYMTYWPALLVGGAFLSSCIYVSGYYSQLAKPVNPYKKALIVQLLVIVSSMVVLVIPYVLLVPPLGRGVMLIGVAISSSAVCTYHIFLTHWKGIKRIRVGVIIGDQHEEHLTVDLIHDCGDAIDVMGVISYHGYQPEDPSLLCLGTVIQMNEIVSKAKLDRVLVVDHALSDSSLFQKFCQLRYMGVVVMPIIGVYEECHQVCPTELVTPEWLLQASTAPQVFYIRKVKRAFDIIASIIGLIVLGPVLLFAIILQKLFSPGPVFYNQARLGRFGRVFHVHKLRTMVVDAEKNGAEWSQKNDPRVTFLGRIFRKYRIDEIPQLYNVLTGEMSFVGPRPEREEFAEMLNDKIPFFLERLLIQPGITGWAQVCYPYGATVEDSRRKLEYDLYYIKNMSLFFDLFILLDTIRIIVTGGSDRPGLMRIGRKARVIPVENEGNELSTSQRLSGSDNQDGQ